MAENIDIVVRARDEASRTLDRVADSVQRLSGSVGKGGKLLLASAAAVMAFKLITKVASETSQAYLDQERSARGLTEAQRDLSASLQDTLAIQDETINQAMRQAKMLGVSEEAMEDVTKAAIGLSAATGQNLNSSMFRINEAINGNANSLASYIPALRDAESETEKLAIISEVAAKGLEMELQKANETEGAILRRQAAMEDLKATIGGILKPSIEFQNALAAIAKIAASVIESISQNFSSGGAFISIVLRGLTESVIRAFSVIETTLQNAGAIFQLASTIIEGAAVFWADTIRHAIVEVIPAYAKWFAENFVSIFRDMAVGVMTIIDNLGKNLGEAMAAIFVWVTGGMKGGLEGLTTQLGDALFVGLLDGFEAQTDALPEIIERQITDRENQLADRAAQLGIALGGAFTSNFQMRMEQFKSIMASFSADFDLDTNLDLNATLEKQSNATTKALSAVESRLLTRGESDDPLEIAKQGNKLLEANTKIAAETKAIQQQQLDQMKNQAGVQIEVVT